MKSASAKPVLWGSQPSKKQWAEYKALLEIAEKVLAGTRRGVRDHKGSVSAKAAAAPKAAHLRRRGCCWHADGRAFAPKAAHL